VITAQFDDASPFSDGMAVVNLKSKTRISFGSAVFEPAYIDKAGKIIVPAGQYEDCQDFSEGLAAVCKGGKYGYIDKTGATVIPHQFDDATGFSDGLAMVSTNMKQIRASHSGPKNGNCRDETESLAEGGTFIDKTGKVVLTPEFDAVDTFSDGLARVLKGDLYGYIDKTGKIVIEPKFRYAGKFHEGLAYFLTPDNRYGYIDRNGQVAIKAQFEKAGPFHEGFAVKWICP
jgi:serine/threonine-protein kinase